ncbi:hypothetical protein OO014_07990 [Intrasporangium calvum]|uniref:Uncharacterized protein n=1 Tax=Intrasporangium calvum TaxID=53358 RepID=A0ABT5GG27_9MICO|nr:hypothetical protein [Intrasporangium calvum]MDC5697197.1 hypothetical protein [Intrasporangium calvum]
MTRNHPQQSAIVAMYAGLALTAVATASGWVDRASGNVLADHLRAGYPSYSVARIDTAVSTWLGYLSILGALGAIGWWWAIRSVRKRRRWARTTATGLFGAGLAVALFNLVVRDTSGDTGLPPLLAWIGMLPALAGLLAVALLWRSQRDESSQA